MTRFAESIYCDRPVCLWCNNLLTKPSFKILPLGRMLGGISVTIQEKLMVCMAV